MNCYCKCGIELSEYQIFCLDNEPIVEELVDIKRQKEVLEAKEKALRNKLLNGMNKHHIERMEYPTCSILAVEDSNFNRVDTSRLKKHYPSAYHDCLLKGYKDSYLVLRLKGR